MSLAAFDSVKNNPSTILPKIPLGRRGRNSNQVSSWMTDTALQKKRDEDEDADQLQSNNLVSDDMSSSSTVNK